MTELTPTSDVGLFDPYSGASGDMILGAALGAGADLDRVREVLDRLNVSGWTLEAEATERGGLVGVRAVVEVDRDAPPRTWVEIRNLLQSAKLPPTVQRRSLSVFRRLAEVESQLHGVDIDDIHFHEVGGLDALVDIVGGCTALASLECRKFISSPVAVGTGRQQSSHGWLPIPSPATVSLLHGIPVMRTGATSELCTPTGAAMLAEWVDDWTASSTLTPSVTAYGAGTRELPETPNLLRLVLAREEQCIRRESVVELRTLIDDQSPEMVAAATDTLRQVGALDVWTTPTMTKKNRMGVELVCLCLPHHAPVLEAQIFRTTTTLGIRRAMLDRSVLGHGSLIVQVHGERIRVKLGHLGGEAITASPEYDDCVAAATRIGCTVRHVNELAVAAYWEREGSCRISPGSTGIPGIPVET